MGGGRNNHGQLKRMDTTAFVKAVFQRRRAGQGGKGMFGGVSKLPALGKARAMGVGNTTTGFCGVTGNTSRDIYSTNSAKIRQMRSEYMQIVRLLAEFGVQQAVAAVDRVRREKADDAKSEFMKKEIERR